MVKAKCIQSVAVAGLTDAAAPPSNQDSPLPVPMFSLNVWLVALPSRKNLNPLVRLLGLPGLASSGGLMTSMPARSGAAFNLYHMTALNSGFVRPVAGKVRYESVAPA